MLEPILQSTRHRIEALPSLQELKARGGDAPPVRDLAASLSRPGLGVIAEVKRRSPSRGQLDPLLDPALQAERYQGADAISVLTEPDFFSGSNEDLEAVRKVASVPVLRKDFTLDPAQVWEARAIGADAILLIVSILDADQLRRLLGEAGEAGMTALVEVHDEAEIERALEAGAAVVGVNNRDLQSFTVDLAVSERLAPLLVDVPVRVAESGIFSAGDAARMRQAGYQAVLVGEALVKAKDPAGLIRELENP